jgi:hypothetical protein
MLVEEPLPVKKKNKTASAGQANGAGAGIGKGSNEQDVAHSRQPEEFLAPAPSKKDIGSHQVFAATSGGVDKETCSTSLLHKQMAPSLF